MFTEKIRVMFEALKHFNSILVSFLKPFKDFQFVTCEYVAEKANKV